MVVFALGLPCKKDYRRFLVRSVEGPDDYAMMQEVLSRRMEKHKSEDKENGKDRSFGETPDLIVVDGGKGQVSAAKKALSESGYANIPLIGLAKEREEIFFPDASEPLVLSHSDQGLRLLQRIRDEAHRFAVTYHRNLRTRRMVQSVLDQIPGVGKRRKTLLLKEYGSLAGIRKADPADIRRLTGMSLQQVNGLMEQLQEAKASSEDS